MLSATIAARAETAPAKRDASILDSARAFFSWEWTPIAIEQALGAFVDRRYGEVLAYTSEMLAPGGSPAVRNDAELLRGLALVGLGWDDLAARSFHAVLDARPVSPYYPLALLELLSVHDRAGRTAATAETYARYADAAWRGADARSGAIVDLLFAYGDLRTGGFRHSRREKEMLSNPKELKVRLEHHDERASERIFYLGGLAALRLERYGESVDAFQRIGILSPFYRFAAFGIAQNLRALGRGDDALAATGALTRYPTTTAETRALQGRSHLLGAWLLAEAGEPERAIHAAYGIPRNEEADDPARFLRASMFLERKEPALALAEWQPALAADAGPSAVAGRALGMATAYAALGDARRAAEELRAGAARIEAERRDGDAREKAAGVLTDCVAEAISAEGAHDRERRVRLARGIRFVVARQGPFGFGQLIRRIFLPEVPASDLRSLTVTPPAERCAREAPVLWLAFLHSSRRAAIERALALADGIRSAPKSATLARSILVVAAMLDDLEHTGGSASAQESAARAAAAVTLIEALRSRGSTLPSFDVDAAGALPAGIAEYRRRLVVDVHPLEKAASAELAAATRDAELRMKDLARHEAEELIDEHNQELHDLSRELEVAKGRALAEETAGLAGPPSE